MGARELSSEIENVVVVGGGIMGGGISQVLVAQGLSVTMVDISSEQLEKSRARIEKALQRLVEKEKIGQDEADAAVARLSTSTALEEAAEQADHAIESVVENFEIKRDVLEKLDRHCRDEVILATNTSQFSISALGAVTDRPDRVIGSHWFNPPPLMDLIEIILGVETSQETLDKTLALAERYGKRTIVCEKDTPGFITSRLIIALGLEAMRIVEEGIASAEDVNLACRKAFNHAMGPLETMDFSGLDTALNVANAMREQYGDRFLAPQNLRALVNGGHLGRKTGRGFSDYEDGS